MKDKVKDYVEVASRFSRSVNLNADYNRDAQDYGYIITGNVLNALKQILKGLIMEGGQKSYSLFGLFGSGKSAFAVYLTQLLSIDKQLKQKALQMLSGKGLDNSLKKFLQDRDKSSYLPVLITGRRRPINQLIMEGVIDALMQLPKYKGNMALLSELAEQLSANLWMDSQVVVKAIDKLGLAAKSAGLAGILLIVDEAGKALEYALYDRGGGDVFILQELAEHAQRQSSYSLLFIITLHQQIDSYSELLSRTNRAEWAKIQERFATIRFNEPPSSAIQMLAEAIKPVKSAPKEVAKALDDVLQEMANIEGILPNPMDQDSFGKSAHKAWPIHPTLLLALPHIFKRFAQNERSMFSYLTSEEHYGFQNQIRDNTVEDDYGFIRIKDIYDFLLSNYELGLSRSPHSRKMLEANDVINSRYRLTEMQINALKTIAVLNSLAEISPLRATQDMLKLSLPPGQDIEVLLHDLQKQSLITYRRLDGSYRIWEGSDVDLAERLNEAERHLHFDTQLFLDTIDKHLSQNNLVARRHSLAVGVVRYFALKYTDDLAEASTLLKSELKEGASGLVLVLIPNEQYSVLVERAEAVTKKYPQILVAIPRQIDSLTEIVNELACLKWVEQNTKELRDDRIARRELNLRITAYERELNKNAGSITDPRPSPQGNGCAWFWMGKKEEVGKPVDVSKLLSKACDILFNKSPILRNELVARDDISNAASSARRKLMELMLTQSEREALGMSGYPAERSIYESILKASGLHIYDEKLEEWKFQAPPGSNDMKLYHTWQVIERNVFNDELESCELTVLFDKLAKIPYGLPQGVFPILITAFYVAHQGEVLLYREGTLIPDPQPAHFDLLQRRLDLFAIKGVKLQGTKQRIVERLANSLNTEPKIAAAVKALYRNFALLPNITLKTNQMLNQQTLQVRNTFLNATSAINLLFKELPECFGIEINGSDDTSDEAFDTYFTGLNSALQHLGRHAGQVLEKARDQVLFYCELGKGKEAWLELENRCSILAERIKHDELTPFINSVLNGAKNGHDPTPAVSNVSKRSFEQWLDSDIDRFEGLAKGKGELFVYYWNSFGAIAPEYADQEEKQASSLRQTLEAEIAKMKESLSTKEIRKMLQELLAELAEE